MIADLSSLKKKVTETVEAGSLADQVGAIDIESDIDRDELEFLRVVIALKAGGVADEELERLLEDVEKAISELDERYTSVRFLDAA